MPVVVENPTVPGCETTPQAMNLGADSVDASFCAEAAGGYPIFEHP